MLGPALALGSSLFGGSADFLGGTTSRRIGTAQFMLCAQLGGLVLAGGWVALAGDPVPRVAALAVAAAAGVSLVVGIGAFFQAMVVGAISIAAPISAVGVIVPIAAGVIAGEQVSALQAAGMLAALGGIVLVARRPHSAVLAPARSSIALALVAALGGGVCLWLIALASRDGGVPWTLFCVRVTTASLLALGMCRRRIGLRRLLQPPIALRLLAFVLLGFFGFALYALATLHGQLALVAVLASLYPAVTVLLARHLLHERLHRPQLLGVATMLLGVVLISS
ncbi:MAG: DMT family transporter [Solirubrobacteraceae bacterium]